MNNYENQDPNREADKFVGSAEYWYDENSNYHREGDLPAITDSYGYEEHWKHGMLHRDGGKPAVTHQDGCVEYWVDGKQVTPLGDYDPENPKASQGAMKAPMHTIPTIAAIQLANVMATGAHKYGYHNFRGSRVDAQTYIGAMNRHFLKWQDGVDFDDESGMHELAHLMACCSIIIDAHFTGNLNDNRSKTGLVESLLKDSAEKYNNFRGE